MRLTRLRRHWDALGKEDPFRAVLSSNDARGSRWRVEEFFATGEQEIEGVMTYLASLEVKLDRTKALDFGCGIGRLTQAFASRFHEVWGVDIAPSMIEQARHFNRHPRTCHYRLNGRSDLRIFENGTFGFIYSNIVLQHIEPRYQQAYLREFVRVLASGGVLMFQLPSERIERWPSPGEKLGGLKRVFKSITPPPLLDAYRRIRRELANWGEGPVVEMWGMPLARVVGLLEEQGATLVDVRPDGWAEAAGRNGFRYAATK